MSDGDELANHLPRFPDPETDEDYNAQILAKREYSIHATKNKQQNGIYFNHQRLSQIHLGLPSPNRKLFINKFTGLGKTVDAIGIAETRHELLGQILDTSDPSFKIKSLNKALIIAQNKTTLDDNFKKDIMGTCTAGCYETEALKKKTYKTESKKLGAKTRAISTAYDLKTQYEFANKLAKMTPEEIAKKYSFRVIIIDEIHKVKAVVKTVEESEDGGPDTDDIFLEKVKSGKHIHDALMKLIDNVYGCVIVIMSATPIVNDINEYPSIINFVLEKHERINPEEFRELTAGDDLDQIEEDLEELLVPRLRGKISRMRLPPSKAKSVVRTNQDPNGPKLLRYSDTKLWLTTISNNNDEYIDYSYLIAAYANAVALDSKSGENKFYLNSQYASNMVWPGATYGRQAFALYIQPNQDGISFSFTEAFMNDFRFQMHNSRIRLVTELRKAVEMLKQRNETEKSPVITDDIENKEALIEAYMDRINKNPNGTYDYNDPDDLPTMLYTIKSRYSPVFATIIEQIIGVEYYNEKTKKYEYIVTPETNSFDPLQFSEKDKDNRECAYIYNFYKEGGIVAFGLLLGLFGYQPLSVGDASLIGTDGRLNLSRGRRYALLFSPQKSRTDATTEASMSNAKIRRILEVANHPANKYGHYLKVVAGTAVSAQGVNFYNMRQGHMSGRSWNEAGNLQTEGRIDRPGGSHKAFDDDDPIPSLVFADPETGKDISVQYDVIPLNGRVTRKYAKVFRHVGYYPDINTLRKDGTIMNESIGLKMYDDAAEKELKISIPLKIQERIAYDLVLNLQPGEELEDFPLGFDDSNPGTLVNPGEDYSTYNLFYARKELESLKCRIRGFFQTHFRLRLDSIMKLLTGSHRSTIIKALTEMVNDNERIIDRSGSINYLREEKDVFFLQKQSRSLRQRDQQWLSYYSEHSFAREGVNLVEMYRAYELSNVERALTELKTIRPEDSIKLKAVLHGMTTKSLGILVETLVTSSKHLIAEGKLNHTILPALFNELQLSVFYFPKVNAPVANGAIVHTYEIRVRQESQSGGREKGLLIPENSRGELRIYSFEEGSWRNSYYVDDITYIPLIRDATMRSASSKTKTFDIYGTSIIKDGYHIFKLQDKMHIAETSSRSTRTGHAPKNAASVDGTVAHTINNVKMLLWHLYSVKVDVHALVRIYDEKVINTPFGPRVIKPILLVKLREDSLGKYVYQGRHFSVDTWGTNGQYMVTNDLNLDVNAHRMETVVHYTHVYPEILGWIFMDEVAKMDTKIVNPNNRVFFPSMNMYGNKGYYMPIVPALEPGYDHYRTILDLLPESQNRQKELYDVVLGSEESTVGYVISRDSTYQTFTSKSLIFSSLELLYLRIFNGLGLDAETVSFPHSGNHTNQILTIAERFERVFTTVGKRELALLIFILYYLRDPTSL